MSSVRTCGDCRACCQTLGVAGLKPPQEACPNAAPKGKPGCAVYATRPSSCAGYACEWLRRDLPRAWRPDRLGLIFDVLEPEPNTVEAKLDEAGVPWLTVREVWPRALQSKRVAKALAAANENAALVLHFYTGAPAIAPKGSLL